MITQRRIFQVRPDMTAALVEKLTELMPSLGVGHRHTARVYTGLLRGQTNLVVLERDVESAGHLLAEGLRLAARHGDADAYWRECLAPLIDGETVELWHREDTTPLSPRNGVVRIDVADEPAPIYGSGVSQEALTLR